MGKKHVKGGKKYVARPRLTADEYEVIVEYQKEKEAHQALLKDAEKNGYPADMVNHYWFKGKSISAHVRQEQTTYLDVKEAVIKEMQSYAPVYPLIKRKRYTDPHLLVVDPADLHIGKLADENNEDYNIEIAVKRIAEGIGSLIATVSSFEIDKIALIIGNDVLHTDNARRTTTSGTSQDTDGMWHNNFIVARKMYVSIIEHLLTIADVHIIYNPSNHDYVSGFMLADSVVSWFHNNPNVTADSSIAHRKYMVYGCNLIGTTHGDGAKENDLPDLMKLEAKKGYALADYCYWYVHHLHHKIRSSYIGKSKQLMEKDHRDVTVLKSNGKSTPTDKVHVEYVRTMSGTDSWHDRNGYTGQVKAIECFLHHFENGQVARFTHHFK